jgi:hypothetical protein
MNDTELINRVLALSPSELVRIKFHLNKPLNRTKKLTYSKFEEVYLTSPYQSCDNCEKMTVSQSREDYHILENSCQYRRFRKWNENSKRLECKEWHVRRRTIPVTEEVEEDGAD